MMIQTWKFTPAEAAALVDLRENEVRKEMVLRFLTWKESLVSNPDIMGGAETFPNTRLTVRHVGEMIEKGADSQEILEDYPYLDKSDLEFSHLNVRAYPEAK